MAALLGMVLLGFAALSVDVGYLYAVRTETQDSADIAAMAAAAELRDVSIPISARLTNANTVAAGYVTKNLRFAATNTGTVTVTFGHWDDETNQFVPNGGDIRRTNAVRISVARIDIPFHFAKVFGKPTFKTTATAVARLGDDGCKIYSKKKIKIEDNSIVDSYDFMAGGYGGTGLGDNGHLCSCDEIEAKDSAQIFGDVNYIKEFKGDPSIVSGELNQMSTCEQVLTAYSVGAIDNFLIGLTDEGEDPFDANGDLVEVLVGEYDAEIDDVNVQLNGVFGYDANKHKIKLKKYNNLDLPAGTFFFEKIELDEGATLTITGPTVLYIEKEIDVHDGSIINLSQDPLDLQIIHAGKKFHMKSSGDFYGTLLGPNVKAKIEKGGDFFGTMMVKETEFKDGSSFHGDSSLPFRGVEQKVVLVQ